MRHKEIQAPPSRIPVLLISSSLSLDLRLPDDSPPPYKHQCNHYFICAGLLNGLHHPLFIVPGPSFHLVSISETLNTTNDEHVYLPYESTINLQHRLPLSLPQ